MLKNCRNALDIIFTSCLLSMIILPLRYINTLILIFFVHLIKNTLIQNLSTIEIIETIIGELIMMLNILGLITIFYNCIKIIKSRSSLSSLSKQFGCQETMLDICKGWWFLNTSILLILVLI